MWQARSICRYIRYAQSVNGQEIKLAGIAALNRAQGSTDSTRALEIRDCTTGVVWPYDILGKLKMDRFINVNSHSRDDLNQARSGSDFGPNYPVLGGRYVVYEEIYTTVQESVDEVLTCLVPGVDYEADELIGHSLWDDMTPTGKREMLISLKHLASLPNSPLKLSDSGVRGKGRTLFQLRTPEEMAA